ncbi:uncharacterized protein [Nicotiana tomentosiformis]|uniref:uncharacterized protein n=1 Tax=Nicotiana tomentosiformis TaxID=4098 RepID=UPI00388CBA70
MIIAIWNIRGLNKPFKQKEFKLFLNKNKVDLIGCIETRVKEPKSKIILNKIVPGWEACYNYPNAVNGRIWLLWKRHLRVQIISIAEQLIHCTVEETTGFSTHLTIVYAKNDLQQRDTLWNELRFIGNQIPTPWHICENFNNVLSTEDRIGAPVTQQEIQEFQHCIDTLQLSLLKTIGWHFTWCNKQQGTSRVYSKIDWAFRNYHWLQKHGHIEADYMNPSVSDHSPILIHYGARIELHPRPFKVFSNVLHHPEFRKKVENTWHLTVRGDPRHQVLRKLHLLKDNLKELIAYMASYKQKLEQLREELEVTQANLKHQPQDQLLIDKERQILLHLEKWSSIEE